MGSQELILLNVGFSRFDANWNWQGVYSPFARIYYVTEGCARTRIGNEVYFLEPDNLYLTPPFTLHDDMCEGPFALYYIHFYEDATAGESIFDRYDLPIKVPARELDGMLAAHLLEINPGRELSHYDPGMYDNQPTFSQYLACNMKLPAQSAMENRGILLQMLAQFVARATLRTDRRDDRITAALDTIHNNIDSILTISTLAGKACLTDDHFIRLFRKETGVTPVQYINRKKIERAQLLLLTTDMPLTDIAFSLAFESLPYFSRLFRQHTGSSPAAYRRTYNELH